MRKFFLLLIFGTGIAVAAATQAAVCTFDDNLLPPESHWGGAGSGEAGFTSGDAYFPHNDGGWSWDGFAYSNETDTTTAGISNQFSAITGGGVLGSANYGLGYIPSDWASGTYDPIPQTVSLGAVTGENYNQTLSGAWFTNTTYAYLAMRDGDSYAKQFGGESGDDPDWFKLIVRGIDEQGGYTAPIDFYLADFRFSDNSQDYILDEWTWVDLSGLGPVVALEFSVDSSDKGAYGINTPTYFALDNLTVVPLPGAFWLLCSGLAILTGTRKRRS
jgi:hypothetical protein